jgi:GNAT superfamily N-acetyltransferase
MGLRLRDATPDELDAVADLIAASYGQFEEVLDRHWGPYLADIRDVRGRLHDGQLVVAELDGELVGCVTFFPDYRNETIPGGFAERGAGFRVLAVSPAARGHGVGEALVEECIRRARALGAPNLLLHTATFMDAAVRLYERLGFELMSGRDENPRIRLLTYRLPLP